MEMGQSKIFQAHRLYRKRSETPSQKKSRSQTSFRLEGGLGKRATTQWPLAETRHVVGSCVQQPASWIDPGGHQSALARWARRVQVSRRWRGFGACPEDPRCLPVSRVRSCSVDVINARDHVFFFQDCQHDPSATATTLCALPPGIYPATPHQLLRKQCPAFVRRIGHSPIAFPLNGERLCESWRGEGP